jgi:ADP-ribosylglycohydrolase
LLKRDKLSLDLFWLKDRGLTDADALPASSVLAAKIADDLEAALAQFLDWGDPFRRACEAAAVTHGHPSGYLAAGALALMVERLPNGATLADAVAAALARLAREPGHEEVTGALRAAVALAASGGRPRRRRWSGSAAGGWPRRRSPSPSTAR